MQKVEEILDIINGELINTPAIGGFCGYYTQLDEVKRGSLFFALHTDDITRALAKGAFGIVFDGFLQTQLHDEEIAWIKVDSIHDAIIRLVRFILLSKQIKVIATNHAQYLIAQALIRNKSVLFFDDSPMDLLDILTESSPSIIIATSKNVLDLALESSICDMPSTPAFELITPMGMFETKFYYKLHSYKIPLPCVFVPELAAVINMCIQEGLECDFARFEAIADFTPISLTHDAKILSFGTSSRVIIPTNDEEIFLRYGELLHKQAKWAKVVMFLPTILHNATSIHTAYEKRNNKPLESIHYDSANELPLLLQTTQYNFGLIFGISTQGLVFILSQTQSPHNPTLF